MADEKALENEIARAVEADLRPTRTFKVATENNDPMERWLALGHRINADTAARLKNSRDRYEAVHAEVAERLKELHSLKASIEHDESLLDGIRRRLGYAS